MISVIIPIYNAEPYIRQGIENVLAQTYSNWELILVDDGSRDASGTICDEYAGERIITLHDSFLGGTEENSQIFFTIYTWVRWYNHYKNDICQ